ncbi:MAG: hypothetical protein ACLS4Z_03820 [Christensenellaceae bacterium]
MRNREKARALGIPRNVLRQYAEVIANPAVICHRVYGGVETAKDCPRRAARGQGRSSTRSHLQIFHELERTARRNCCGLYFEASCVGGVPIIRTCSDGVQANRIPK